MTLIAISGWVMALLGWVAYFDTCRTLKKSFKQFDEMNKLAEKAVTMAKAKP